MPFRSGLPDEVRGVGAERLGLPSGPAGTGFGKLRHCAAAGSARSSVIAVVASEVRMDVIVCAPFLRRLTRSGGEGAGRAQSGTPVAFLRGNSVWRTVR